MPRILGATAILLASTHLAFAAGPAPTPPTPTETTTVCTDGMVWDEETKTCVAPDQASFDDDTLYGMAREFAYAGQYDNAIAVLQLAKAQDDPRIQTYYGFAHRKAGRVDQGMAIYQAVIDAHPDYLLVRSYMGQAFAEQGKTEAAWAQVAEITQRGGTGTWAHQSLVDVLAGRSRGSY